MQTHLKPGEDLISLYAAGPQIIQEALAGLSESQLDLAKAPGEWTIRQIVHHVVDGDDFWKICIKTALGNPDDMFCLQWYTEKPQTEWSELWKYSGRSLQPSLELLCANRQHILQLLEQIPDALQKTAWLKQWKKRRIKIRTLDVLEILAGHVVDHVEEIKLIRKMHNI